MPVNAVSVSPQLRTALSRAGERSGVEFEYLLQTAMRESRLDPEARAATSSAVGLFQFIESTWLEVIKEQGPALGYGDLARHISRNGDGGYSVADPGTRGRILALREDPAMAADMAAAFTRANGEYLTERFGRAPSPGELYIAHFLGARGAERFFAIGLEAPNSIAADHFPRQAAANAPIFYDHGRARTVREVYRVLVARHDGAAPTEPGPAAAQLAAQQLAAGGRPAMVEVMLPDPALSFSALYRGAAAQPPPPSAPVADRPVAATPDRPGDDAFASFFNRLPDE